MMAQWMGGSEWFRMAEEVVQVGSVDDGSGCLGVWFRMAQWIHVLAHKTDYQSSVLKTHMVGLN